MKRLFIVSERVSFVQYLKGGWSQVEELCRATLIYYPPLAMDQCLSWSSLDQLVTATGQTMPENMTMRYLDYIDPWDLDATNRLKTALDLSTQKGLCSSQQQTPSVSAFSSDNFSFLVQKGNK